MPTEPGLGCTGKSHRPQRQRFTFSANKLSSQPFLECRMDLAAGPGKQWPNRLRDSPNIRCPAIT